MFYFSLVFIIIVKVFIDYFIGFYELIYLFTYFLATISTRIQKLSCKKKINRQY